MPAGTGVRRVSHAGVAGLEARGLGSDAQVAAQGQVHAGPDGRAVDGSNGRLGQGVQAGHQGVGGFGPAVSFQGATGFGFGPLGKVRTGAEAAATAGQHQHTHGWVGVVLLKQGVQGFERRNIQRVALLRTVEGDPGDTGFDLALQRRLSSHASPRIVLFVMRFGA
ncbi:hypothetical protein D3C81_1569790 [compost metagenome]